MVPDQEGISAEELKGILDDADEKYEIPPIPLQSAWFTLYGTTPILVHNFDDKTRQQMEDASRGEVQIKDYSQDTPVVQALRALHQVRLDGPEHKGKMYCGTTATGIKKACARGAIYTGVKSLNMKFVLGLVQAFGDVPGNHDLCLIRDQNGNPMEWTEDMIHSGPVRLPNKAAMIRHRPMFHNWSVHVRFEWIKISRSSMANLLNYAGRFSGAGDMRPEKGGSYGMFTVHEPDGAAA